MSPKVFAGIMSAALLIIFIGPVVVKLKDVALSTVVTIGLSMMFYDLWQSLQQKDD